MPASIPSTDCFKCSSKLCRFASNTSAQTRPRKHVLKRGERLETCANGCMKFWVIIRGTAAVCVSLPDGRRQISSLEMKGATICGPMASPEEATWLEALEPCEVCELDFSDRANELRHDGAFLASVFGVVHGHLTAATRHLTTLGRLDSTERVVLFLAETALEAGGRGPVHLALSRDDIADYLGLNTETVSRIFSRLKKSGLFKFTSPTEYFVPDMAALRRRLPVAVHARHAPGGAAGRNAAEATPDKEFAG